MMHEPSRGSELDADPEVRVIVITGRGACQTGPMSRRAPRSRSTSEQSRRTKH
jgi:hypothetical protein